MLEFTIDNDKFPTSKDYMVLYEYVRKHSSYQIEMDKVMQYLRIEHRVTPGIIETYTKRQKYFQSRSRGNKRPQGTRKYISQQDLIDTIKKYIIDHNRRPIRDIQFYDDCYFLEYDWYDLTIQAFTQLKNENKLKASVLDDFREKSQVGLWKRYFDMNEKIYWELFFRNDNE